LGRVCRLRVRLPAPKAQELASRVESLPSAPETLAVLTAELEAAHGAPDWAGRIIAADPAMAARVLQLANIGIGSPIKVFVRTDALNEAVPPALEPAPGRSSP